MVIMTNRSSATEEFCNQLDELIMQTFGFAFDKWHEKDLWTDDYERYSIIEDGIMLSNISVYKMKMLINGISRDFLQLGSVATRTEHRGRGLARQIMDHILEIYPNTPMFLFADTEAVGYYKKMGFYPFEYKQPNIQCKINQTGEMVRLDVADAKVDRYLRNRLQYSKILDCTNQYAINWFHLLYQFPQDIYEIPQLDLMIVAKQAGSTLTIHDVVASKPVKFADILTYLNFEGVEKIKFSFNPDWLENEYLMDRIIGDDGTVFIKGNFEIESDIIFPIMMTT